MKNTISDISHQLKTPLAALNIYNGLLQDEVEELPEVKEFAVLSEQELSGSDDISILCDRDWLIEAVDNIVKNALDHTGSGDRVRIEWKVLSVMRKKQSNEPGTV